MKKKIITWMFSYEVADSKHNNEKADKIYYDFQDEIEKMSQAEQVAVYIHKERRNG